ncbi:unnamed protein product, partial [Acidithrix sp. C25]
VPNPQKLLDQYSQAHVAEQHRKYLHDEQIQVQPNVVDHIEAIDRIESFGHNTHIRLL